MEWKQDWLTARENLTRWWRSESMAVTAIAPRDPPLLDLDEPGIPAQAEERWTNSVYRCDRAEWMMARHTFLCEAFPYFDTLIGPGSLGTMLGAQPVFDFETVWYTPCISDPAATQPIRFKDEGNVWWAKHVALVEEGLRRSQGRYLIGIPDLIENLDVLAALRGNKPLLYDLVDRPSWVKEKLVEINQAYFDVFDRLHAMVKDDQNGNAFAAFWIWGPGRTAKIQCDFSAMLSPAMFREFAVPCLSEQCQWLDFSLYHLDGTNALQHLDTLLEIEALSAIEWTPQAGRPSGGSSCWYDLYRRIKGGGKAVQAVGVKVEEVIPLLDAIGPSGTYILLGELLTDERAAEGLIKALEPYRT